MITYLEVRNQRLLQLAEHLAAIIADATGPLELEPFKHIITMQCGELCSNIKRNLQLLQLRSKLDLFSGSALQEGEFLKEILAETRKVNVWLQRLSDYYAPPILRSHPHDRLSLYIIGWLHSSHGTTGVFPAAVNSGSVAVQQVSVPIYYFPVVEQRGLLYQPLLIHEYGHSLYKAHRPEMDDLVLELQEDVLHLLSLSRYRNDLFSQEQSQIRREIAYTWYAWTQELFCDAVGLVMGGPSYLYSFSSYLHTLQESDFRREPETLRCSAHPPRWLRIQFLANRADRLGLESIADEVVSEWEGVRDLLEIGDDDYFGYYNPDIDDAIVETLDDMLTEVEPRQFSEAEVTLDRWDPSVDTPVQLLNWAWRVYRETPNNYLEWESRIVQSFD